jgi:hypothetical protein
MWWSFVANTTRNISYTRLFHFIWWSIYLESFVRQGLRTAELGWLYAPVWPGHSHSLHLVRSSNYRRAVVTKTLVQLMQQSIVLLLFKSCDVSETALSPSSSWTYSVCPNQWRYYLQTSAPKQGSVYIYIYISGATETICERENKS